MFRRGQNSIMLKMFCTFEKTDYHNPTKHEEENLIPILFIIALIRTLEPCRKGYDTLCGTGGYLLIVIKV